MSYNGSGVWTANSTGLPVVTGTTISSTMFNAFTSDVATGLSTAVCKDGQQTITANIPMATYKFTGLGNGSTTTDSMAYGQRAKFKVGATTHDVSVTGTQDVTGIGFTPTAVILFAAVNGASYASFGFDDGTTRGSVNDNYAVTAGQWIASTTLGIYIIQGAGVTANATVTALASDKFTLTWAKNGSPTGTAAIYYLAVGY